MLECLPENTDLLLASLTPLGLPKKSQNTEEKLENGFMLSICKHIIQYNTMRHQHLNLKTLKQRKKQQKEKMFTVIFPPAFITDFIHNYLLINNDNNTVMFSIGTKLMPQTFEQ